MLEKDDWKFALEDARFRHNALMQLIYSGDNQALVLLRLFLTMSLAAAGGALSVFLDSWSLPIEVAYSLSAASLLLLSAAIACTFAIMGEPVNLPGRGADFWLWAADKTVEREEVFQSYLRNLNEKHQVNRRRNDKQANALLAAKIGGLTALPVAVLVGATTYVIRHGWPLSS